LHVFDEKLVFGVALHRACERLCIGENMVTKERRSDVRGDLSFNVKYKIMTLEEYKDFNRFDKAIFLPANNAPGVDNADTEISMESKADASLINYLLQMDQKLDQILELLAQDRSVALPFRRCIGRNISGSGMQIVVDQPVETGQIIHAKFFLSKFPLIFMDIFGEAIRVTQAYEYGRSQYLVGIKFLDLNKSDRERIITSVFQRQREALRKRNSEN